MRILSLLALSFLWLNSSLSMAEQRSAVDDLRWALANQSKYIAYFPPDDREYVVSHFGPQSSSWTFDSKNQAFQAWHAQLLKKKYTTAEWNQGFDELTRAERLKVFAGLFMRSADLSTGAAKPLYFVDKKIRFPAEDLVAVLDQIKAIEIRGDLPHALDLSKAPAQVQQDVDIVAQNLSYGESELDKALDQLDHATLDQLFRDRANTDKDLVDLLAVRLSDRYREHLINFAPIPEVAISFLNTLKTFIHFKVFDRNAKNTPFQIFSYLSENLKNLGNKENYLLCAGPSSMHNLDPADKMDPSQLAYKDDFLTLINFRIYTTGVDPVKEDESVADLLAKRFEYQCGDRKSIVTFDKNQQAYYDLKLQ